MVTKINKVAAIGNGGSSRVSVVFKNHNYMLLTLFKPSIGSVWPQEDVLEMV